MNSIVIRRGLLLVIAALLLALPARSTALAQEGSTPPPPVCVPDAQTSCIKIVFSPATLVGDLIVGDQPIEQVQQNTLWVTFASPTPGQTLDVVVTNIHDGAPDNGPLYIYQDVPKTIIAPPAAGQTKTVTLFPVKKYIRGKVEAKCSPQSVQPGEEVGCLVSIDGAPQEGTLAAGQKASYILDPGAHALQFDLTGANAALWSPASLTKTVTVIAGSYPKVVTASFTKAAHITAKLSQAIWIGDFYVDGTLVATQVAAIDGWVKGNATHKIEVKNVALPGSPGIHPFKDSSSSFYASAGATKTVTVTLSVVPYSELVSPLQNPVVTTNDYLRVRILWVATDPQLAETAADHSHWAVALNGVSIGDVMPYRLPVAKDTDPNHCAPIPGCYSVVWLVLLGKLPAGSYVLHIDYSLDATIFDGWDWYEPGTDAWDYPFEVVPAQ